MRIFVPDIPAQAGQIVRQFCYKKRLSGTAPLYRRGQQCLWRTPLYTYGEHERSRKLKLRLPHIFCQGHEPISAQSLLVDM